MSTSSGSTAKKKLKIAIIGSGPSGVAASYILLNKHDCQVDMIDVGLEMDAETSEFKESAKNIRRDIFLDRLEKKRAQLDKKNKNSIPQKLLFGSDFIYQRIAQVKTKIDGLVKLNITFAKGGLGRIWGANISSILQTDIEKWPISEKSLTPYFKQIEHIVPMSSERDALGERFNYQPKTKYSFPLASGSQKILDVSLKNEGTLKNAGIYLGRAKLAVSSKETNLFKKCVSCGLCMHGCPHDSIFDPSIIINKYFKINKSFRYLPDNLVVKINENAEGKITLSKKNTKDNSLEDVIYDKVFVACGSVGSTALILKSFSDCSQKIILKDSQKYLFPFIVLKPTKKSKGYKPTNTLAQLVFHVENLKNTSKIVHIQLYSFNDLMAKPVRKILGKRITNFLLFIFSRLLDKVMIGMMYLHSDTSGHISLRVNPTENFDIELGGSKSKESDMVFKEVKDKINHFYREIGGYIVSRFALKQLPGESQHFGASMPMSNSPHGVETDILGRPFNLKNTHVIDTSILPNIPSTPTTLLVMANASRIADQSLKGEIK